VCKGGKGICTKIYSTISAFAALAHDGSIKVWGEPDYGGANAPAGSGYTKIISLKDSKGTNS
jgi:hypothetical protein